MLVPTILVTNDIGIKIIIEIKNKKVAVKLQGF